MFLEFTSAPAFRHSVTSLAVTRPKYPNDSQSSQLAATAEGIAVKMEPTTTIVIVEMWYRMVPALNAQDLAEDYAEKSVQVTGGSIQTKTERRVDRLRLCGNGVVPLVAAHAWRTLKARFDEACDLTEQTSYSLNEEAGRGFQIRRLSLVVVATFVVAIVGALGIAGPTEAAEKLTAAQEAIVLDGLRKILKDPNSAILGQIKAGTEEGGTIPICGFVNAKNAFGGYTGDKPFFGALLLPPDESFIALGIGGTESDSIALNNTCKRHGLGLW